MVGRGIDYRDSHQQQLFIHAQQLINTECGQLCPGGQGGVLCSDDNNNDVCVYRSDGGSKYCGSPCRGSDAAAYAMNHAKHVTFRV